MKKQILVSTIAVLISLLMAPVAVAQLSSEFAEWDEGPAGFLLTKKEKKEWKGIKTDAAAKEFIELFWARRNPSPETTFNSFKADFDSIVEFSDENFGYGNRRGALTDRAKVLILMGKPANRQIEGPAQTGPVRAGQGADADTPDGGSEIWAYDPAELSPKFKVKGSRLIFVFYEERLGSNIFVLDRTNREAVKAVGALSRAPEVLLLHPDLKEVPKPVSIPGARAAAAQSMGWLGQEAQFNETALVISELGINDAVSRPLWVHLEMPKDAPDLDVLAGRVSASDGELLSTFEVTAEPLAGQAGKAYHLSFPLEEGSYSIDLVGAAGGAPQITTSIEAEVTPVPSEGTWASPLCLGISASPNEDALYGDPYSFGGWHVVPITGSELTRTSEIVYFGFIVRPVVNEEEKVDLKVLVRLKMDGKPIGRPFTLPLEASQVLPDLWMYGNSIGLENLPEPGNYGFDFKVTENGSEVSVEKEVTLEIVE